IESLHAKQGADGSAAVTRSRLLDRRETWQFGDTRSGLQGRLLGVNRKGGGGSRSIGRGRGRSGDQVGLSIVKHDGCSGSDEVYRITMIGIAGDVAIAVAGSHREDIRLGRGNHRNRAPVVAG